MRKHTKAGLVLLMAGMMMAGSVTSAFADTEATAATSGVIDTTKKNAETGGPGSTAASTENTLDGHTYSTEAPGSNTSQTQASTSSEAKLVWRRALASKGDTRTRRCTPFSLLSRP